MESTDDIENLGTLVGEVLKYWFWAMVDFRITYFSSFVMNVWKQHLLKNQNITMIHTSLISNISLQLYLNKLLEEIYICIYFMAKFHIVYNDAIISLKVLAS